VKDPGASNNRFARRILFAVCAAVLSVTFMVSRPQRAHAEDIVVPPMPANIQVTEPGNEVYLVGHGVGTQNYICLPSGSGVAYALFTPEATLFDDDGGQLITHFFSPNPDENGTIRATWERSRDTSTVWAATVPNGSAMVTASAIPWLKLKVVGFHDGPDGGDKLSATTFIQRLSTSGGVAPLTGCSVPTDIGTKAFVPYRADYFFYRQVGNDK